MATIINTKLGISRNKPRVWIEGAKLAREGYAPGDKYDLAFEDARVVLKPSATGQYTVSRRERNGRLMPIIDITKQELAKLFEGVETLRVAINKGKIVISAHHQQKRVTERVERMIQKLKTGEPLRVSSLYHGGGVLDKAMHSGMGMAGVESRAGVVVEMEGKYLDSSIRNNPELFDDKTIVIESPIQDINLARSESTHADLLYAGIPCCGASRAGRSKNRLQFAESHDAAGAMFFNTLSFIEALNPAVVLIENVVEYQSTASMEVVRSVLGSLGYDLHEGVFNGNEFGALENRNRLCAVAISKGLDGVFDMQNVTPTVQKPPRLADMMEDVPLDSDRWKRFDYLADKEKRDKAAGKGFSRQLLTGEEGHCGVIGKGAAKCRSTEPFFIHPHNPDLSRIPTSREHARFKRIPESVIAGLSETVAHEVLGQSVIYSVFEALGLALGLALREASGLGNDKSEPVVTVVAA